MAEKKLTGKELLSFLENNRDFTRADQALKAGYNTILELVEAIAEANKSNPDFWANTSSSDK